MYAGTLPRRDSHKRPCSHQLIIIAGMIYLPWRFEDSLAVAVVVDIYCLTWAFLIKLWGFP